MFGSYIDTTATSHQCRNIMHTVLMQNIFYQLSIYLVLKIFARDLWRVSLRTGLQYFDIRERNTHHFLGPDS